MSKERLKEIKKHRNEADNSTDEYEFEKINFYNLHVDWLIEQAERVQELENKCEYLSDTNEMLLDLNGVLPDQPELYIKLKKEIKRLEDFIETIQNVHFVELQREKAENRRYREAIEVAIHNMSGDNLGDKYALKILEKALEGRNERNKI